MQLETDEFESQGLPRGWPGRVRDGIFGPHHVEVEWYGHETHPATQIGRDATSGPVREIEPISEEEYACRVAQITSHREGG